MATNKYGVVQKNWFTAFLLSLFLGWLGADRFYLGKAGTAVLKLVTIGGLGIWALIDFILIASESMPGVEWTSGKSKEDKKKAWVIFAIVAVIGLIIAVSSPSSDNSQSSTQSKESAAQPTSTKQENLQTAKPAKRQVEGKAATLGAGTFTGGKDIAAGLYDVTPGAGQSGNFIVNDAASYNEVLGSFGVNKVRARISDGDTIKISGLSSVKFTPVKTPFITEHKPVNLYAGTFIVGEDIGEGRYKVTPGSGQSGNFIVNDGASYNEILGSYGVKSVTVSLSNGDDIKLSGLNTAIFTPAN